MIEFEKIKYVAVLGGGLRQNPDGSWRTCRLEEGDNYGITGDQLRVIAASLLYKDSVKINKDLKIIASGGKGQYANIDKCPTVAEVIEKELIDLGVPRDRIIKEDKAGSSYQQLVNILEIFLKNDQQDSVIISNDWHLPRIQAMIESRSELSGLKNSILAGAEGVLVAMEPETWKERIEKSRQTEDYRKRLEIEKNGTEQIKNGDYKFK